MVYTYRMVKEKIKSEKEILRIAKKHFIAFGYTGARMQAIADEAGTNKALLHYYYKSKDGLFKKVFDEEGGKIISSAEDIIKGGLPILEKIKALIKNDIDNLLKNPDMPLFMMREMARDPSLMQKFQHKKTSDNLLYKMFSEIEIAQNENKIRKDIASREIFINISSLVMFPFMSGPFLQEVFKMNKKEYTAWLKNRRETLPSFIINSITPNK